MREIPRISGYGNEPFDYCQRCYEDALLGKTGVIVANYDCDTEHPPYEETEYRCDYCRKPLMELDNWEKAPFLSYS
jgi:hypothetical protein